MYQLQNLIIEDANSWIGTEFQHQGRIKKTELHTGGCDCIGFIFGIAKKFALKSKSQRNLVEFDIINYPKISKNELEIFMESHFYQVSLNQLQMCDLILFKIGKYLQHVAMLYKKEGNNQYIIHSHISSNSVKAHRLDEYWSEKIFQCYRFADLFDCQ